MGRESICGGIAVLAIVCTLAILLFPVSAGPYPVTHGPVTSLEAMQAGLLLWLSIAIAGLALLPCVPFDGRLSRPFNSLRFCEKLFGPQSLEASSVLRC